MKEQILKSLKTKYGNLGFNADALDGVAAFLENNITEESQIDTAVENAKGMLSAFNSDADRRSKSAKTDLETLQGQFDAYKAANPEANPNPNLKPENKPDGQSFSAEEVQKLIDESQKKLLETMQSEFGKIETAKTQSQLKADAFVELEKNPLYRDSKINAAFMKDKFDNLSGEYNSVEEILEAAKDSYMPILASIGVEEAPDGASGGGANPQAEVDFNNFVNKERKVRGQEELKSES